MLFPKGTSHNNECAGYSHEAVAGPHILGIIARVASVAPATPLTTRPRELEVVLPSQFPQPATEKDVILWVCVCVRVCVRARGILSLVCMCVCDGSAGVFVCVPNASVCARVCTSTR